MSIGHYENFPVASLLLPAHLRAPIAVIYRFARNADDFADEGDDPPQRRLEKLDDYRRQLESPVAPLMRDLQRVVRHHALPVRLFHDLLDAFAQDVTKTRYANFAEVLDYCRRSANPVGRLLLHLFKRTSETELTQSDAVCTALQLTNFWQDIPIDFAKNRIYLPEDEMRKFNVVERHIADGRCDHSWRALMTFQVDRARTLLLSGQPLARSLSGRISMEIRLTIEGGLRILEKLEKQGYNMYQKRPTLKIFDWPLLFLRAMT